MDCDDCCKKAEVECTTRRRVDNVRMIQSFEMGFTIIFVLHVARYTDKLDLERFIYNNDDRQMIDRLLEW